MGNATLYNNKLFFYIVPLKIMTQYFCISVSIYPVLRSKCPVLWTISSEFFPYHHFWAPRCCFSAENIWSTLSEAISIKLITM